jgi:iron complex outermembrane receptor protein
MFTYGKNRLNINYFVEQAFFIKKFSASLGFSGNYNSMFKHNFAFGANMGYEFYRNSHIYFNINRALRLPTFTDLYYKSATQTSNQHLNPENSLTIEIGGKYSSKRWHTNVSLFERFGRDIIDWIKLPEEDKWHSTNHAAINTFGGEFSIGYRGKWLKNVEAGYSCVNANKKADNYISKYALDYLQHKATVRVEHCVWKNFGAAWQFSVQKRNGSYEDAAKNIIEYKPFGLFDGRIYWRNENINLFVEANNILNVKYFDFGGIAQPQRQIRAGIEVSIEKF